MRLRILMAFALLCLCTLAAQAESFSVNFLRGDDVALLGIDSAGTVLVQEFNPCNIAAGSPNNCYEEWANGVMTYRGDTSPAGFLANNGVSCSPPSAVVPSGSTCNNGFHVWEDVASHDVREAFPGGDPLGVPIYSGTSDGPLFVNSAGDFVTFDGIMSYLVEVQVAQTPEPSSFALLGTGLLGVAGVIRKRLA